MISSLDYVMHTITVCSIINLRIQQKLDFFLHIRQVKQAKDLQKNKSSIINVMNPQKMSLF